MQATLTCLSCLILGAALASQDTAAGEAEKQAAKPKLESIGPIAFAAGDTLLVSDPKAAVIYSFDISDLAGKGLGNDTKIEKIQEKIAALAGTEGNRISIADIAVHPGTKQAYISARRGRGANATPMLIQVGEKGKLKLVSLSGRKFTSAGLENAPAARPEDAAGRRGGRRGGRGRRGGNRRMMSITDLAFVKGKVVVAGLSNEEFASKLRVLDYPFKSANAGASVEIFHGAHGRYETRAPVRTFIPYEVEGRPHIVAAYTCTPLVIFPLADIEPGKKIKGKTIAELGNQNNPLDIIVYTKKGEDYFLMTNSARGVMKIKTKGMEKYDVVEKVNRGGRAGLPYETIEDWKGVVQLDKLDAKHALILQSVDGGLTLKAIPLP